MLKPDNRKTRKKAFELPRLVVGDVLLVGKFKNRKATITGFSSDENNQPVAQTDKGEHKIFKPRIAKLMPITVLLYCISLYAIGTHFRSKDATAFTSSRHNRLPSLCSRPLRARELHPLYQYLGSSRRMISDPTRCPQNTVMVSISFAR